ncbi:hypothetical protein QFC21_004973 [Naganishia friedmannii]|uniref:Uncharacterized protein n=1 Tax=Naganishia friedmannii TaxID=89922 RepID=A0ACC2VE94_9TREE|nr:hypothetical protein QFC21_004973 [Naganishia friedmannii]
MSNDMVPCIAFALSGLARKQGSLDEVVKMPGLVQVERFQTFRNSPADTSAMDGTGNATSHDNTQLITWVMDSRCRIRVFFDVEATNRIEKASCERVTSYLRSLVYLKEYKFVILPPSDTPHSEKDYYKSSHRKHPELVLHVYDWQKYIGSSDDPLYHEEAEYLLSNFLSYSLDGNDGRVPKGYGVAADEVIWRKQENEALGFVRNQWETSQSSGLPEHTSSTEEPTEEHLLEAPYRHVLMSMLRSMEPEKERVVENIKVFGINPLEELDVMEITKVLLDNGVNIIPDTPPQAKIPVRKQPEPPRQVPRKKACRKSTGRKLPQARRSHSTMAKSPEISEIQPLVTQHIATQSIRHETKAQSDTSARLATDLPETAKAGHGLTEEDAKLKEIWERNKHLILYPHDPVDEVGIASSQLNPFGSVETIAGARQGGSKRQVIPSNGARGSSLATRFRESEPESSTSMHHSGAKTLKLKGKDRDDNKGCILRNPSPAPPHPLSSPLSLTTQMHKTSRQAHRWAPASHGEASSPVPLPSSQKVIRNDRDKEDSDMDQDGPQSAQARSRRLSSQYLFELDSDEDGLYDFEVTANRSANSAEPL